MESLNKIHKKYIGKKNGTPFADWLSVEKMMYKAVSPKDMEFQEWVNEKYAINGENAWYNTTGDEDKDKSKVDKAVDTSKEVRKEVSSWLDKLNDIKDSITGAMDTKGDEVVSDNDDDDLPKDTKSILGMPKPVFWGLTGIVGLTAIVFVVKKIRG